MQQVSVVLRRGARDGVSGRWHAGRQSAPKKHVACAGWAFPGRAALRARPPRHGRDGRGVRGSGKLPPSVKILALRSQVTQAILGARAYPRLLLGRRGSQCAGESPSTPVCDLSTRSRQAPRAPCSWRQPCPGARRRWTWARAGCRRGRAESPLASPQAAWAAWGRAARLERRERQREGRPPLRSSRRESSSA